MLICDRCNRVIIPNWERYIPTRDGVMHSYHITHREIRWLVLIALLALFGLTAATAHAADRKIKKPPGTGIRGCIVTVYRSGHVNYQPFFATARKATPSETGEAEIWGFILDGSHVPANDGLVYPVNVAEWRFIVYGKIASIRGAAKPCKCPPYWSSTMNAED